MSCVHRMLQDATNHLSFQLNHIKACQRKAIFHKPISIKRCTVQTPTYDRYKIQDKKFKENSAYNRNVEQQKFCVDFNCNSAHFALLQQTLPLQVCNLHPPCSFAISLTPTKFPSFFFRLFQTIPTSHAFIYFLNEHTVSVLRAEAQIVLFLVQKALTTENYFIISLHG